MLYLIARRSTSLTGQEAPKGVQNAARVSEAAKGREVLSGRHLRDEEKIALGRQLIQAKERLPHGHFGPWLIEHGISAHRAHQCMKLARAVQGSMTMGEAGRLRRDVGGDYALSRASA